MPFSSQIGKSIHDLPTPCLVVSEKAYKNNCKNMIEKACQMGVQLRGQTKTHKTIEGAILQTGGTKRYEYAYLRGCFSTNATVKGLLYS